MAAGGRGRGGWEEGEVGRGGGEVGGMTAWLVGTATAGHTGCEGERKQEIE